MNGLRLEPARRFRGRFRLPGDKSVSHRVAILGALAGGTTRASGYSTADLRGMYKRAQVRVDNMQVQHVYLLHYEFEDEGFRVLAFDAGTIASAWRQGPELVDVCGKFSF